MEDIRPSDIEQAYRSGARDKVWRDKAMKNLQMQTDYLPIRIAQTWTHMMGEAYDEFIANVERQVAKGNTTTAFGEATLRHTWLELKTLFSPLAAAAKELARPVDGFMIDLGFDPKTAKAVTGVVEFGLNLITPGSAVKAVGGVRNFIGVEKAAAQILKVRDAAGGIIEVSSKAPFFSRAGTAARQQAMAQRDLGHIAAEELFAQLNNPNGARAVAQVSQMQIAKESENIALGLMRGEDPKKVIAKGEAQSATRQLSPEDLAQVEQFQQMLRPQMPAGITKAQRENLVRQQEAATQVEHQANLVNEQEWAALAREKGLTAYELKTRAASSEMDIRNLIEDVNAKLKSRLSTDKTLEGAASTVRGAPSTATETERTLEAARATMLGKNTDEQVMNQMENLRKRLVDKGCL